jgi:hypothetical protein
VSREIRQEAERAGESLLIGHQQKKIGTFGTHFGSKKQESGL